MTVRFLLKGYNFPFAISKYSVGRSSETISVSGSSSNCYLLVLASFNDFLPESVFAVAYKIVVLILKLIIILDEVFQKVFPKKVEVSVWVR